MALLPVSEPEQPVTFRWMFLVSLTQFGLNLGWITAIQIQLPVQLGEIDPARKETALALVLGVGAFLSMVGNPLFGALSDRTRGRHGRRRPWVLCGSLGGAAGLVLIGVQESVLGVAAGWALVQVSLNAVLAAAVAALPDHVPVRQRGTVSAWWAVLGAIGPLAGGVVVTLLVTGRVQGYLATAALLLATTLPFLFVVGERDAVAPSPPFRLRAFLAGFWISPRRHPDFAWAWISRFLIMLSISMGTSYLLYYLRDEVRHPDAEQGVVVLLVVYTTASILTALAGGWLSDLLGKRRALACAGGLVGAGAAVLLGVTGSWETVIVAAVVLGMGSGAFFAVDQAIITQVLPSPEDRAKDLGIINIANAGPQVLAPVVAAPLVTLLGGYPTLYAVTALIGVAGGVLVWRIRDVP
ncbi:MFS transporter [Nonomuraea sp. NN258]|uniref:MFS transporter n=1 Tax=Nonomuraea antri TaxID=2730852 RepID=UPI001569BB4A|nr:MFS transporter [Nonomuraea antri]NRQ37602.1 MFS transporter [Nonomuraea antri]